MDRKLWVLLLIVISTLLGACAPLAASPLSEARATWAAQGIDDYRFTLRRNCFCPVRGPVVVEVRDGEVVSVVDATTGASEQDGFALIEVFGDAATVDALLNTIAEAEGAARLEADYDADLGYPTHVYIDESELIADEEIGYDLEEFVVLD